MKADPESNSSYVPGNESSGLFALCSSSPFSPFPPKNLFPFSPNPSAGEPNENYQNF
jgi:hypothetical protein